MKPRTEARLLVVLFTIAFVAVELLDPVSFVLRGIIFWLYIIACLLALMLGEMMLSNAWAAEYDRA
jgi:hypothetical protein